MVDEYVAEYFEGRITAHEVVLGILRSLPEDNVAETLDRLPAELMTPLREFVLNHKSPLRTTAWFPPSERQIASARTWLTGK